MTTQQNTWAVRVGNKIVMSGLTYSQADYWATVRFNRGENAEICKVPA